MISKFIMSKLFNSISSFSLYPKNKNTPGTNVYEPENNINSITYMFTNWSFFFFASKLCVSTVLPAQRQTSLIKIRRHFEPQKSSRLNLLQLHIFFFLLKIHNRFDPNLFKGVTNICTKFCHIITYFRFRVYICIY